MKSLLDYKFDIKLSNWTPLTSQYHSIYSGDEINALHDAASRYNDLDRTIVFLSFENRLATGGGLGAVVKLLPQKIKESGENIVLMSPYFKNIKSMNKAPENGDIEKIVDNERVVVDQKEINYSIYKDLKTEFESFYIELEDYFEQSPTPYDHEDGLKLIEDSFAFATVVPVALARLNKNNNLLIHANDWETAPTIVTIKNALINKTLNSAKTAITLHNSYDAEIKHGEDIRYTGRKSRASTVLQFSVPFLDAPLSTVSWPFAIELTRDNLQTGFFASHLQYLFSMNSPVGINNGLFARYDSKKKSTAKDVLKQKKSSMADLWEILKCSSDERVIGKIDAPKYPWNKPILFMSGRMDLMQKGFDVIFHAFRKIKRGSAALVFSPSITNERELESLSFFRNIVDELEGDVSIWPFRIPRDQYDSFLKGSSYFVMPSLYEPFGAANEAFINSTPVIARATGGLWAQVDPLHPCPTPEYLIASSEDPENPGKPTGILYREEYIGNADDWRSIMSLPCENRIDNPLYNSMVNRATDAINMAIDLFKDEQVYAQMIINGEESLAEFDWSVSVEKYKALYNCVQRSTL